MQDTLPTEEIKVSLPEFFRAFGYAEDETIFFRRINDRKKEEFPTKMQCPLGNLENILPTLKRFNSQMYGIFFVVNGGGDDIAGVKKSGCCKSQFFEMDEDSFEIQWEKINSFQLEPSCIIQTKKSLHTYFFLRNGDIQKFRNIQRRFIQLFGSDSRIQDESRVMRVPGFNHCKHEPVPVKIIHWKPELRYTQEEIEAVLPELETTPTEQHFSVPDAIPEGERNDTLYKLACSLQAKGLSDSAIYAAVMAENQSRCNPVLSDQEVQSIVRSALKHDKGLSAEYQTAKNQAQDESPGTPTQTNFPAFEVFATKREKGLDPLKPELITGVLREETTMLLSGDSKAGKTFCLLQLAIAFAEGGVWLETFHCQQCKVLYVNLEVVAAESNERINKLYAELGYSNEISRNLVTWNLRGYQVNIDQLVSELKRKIPEENNLKVVFIDPFYEVFEGDENNAKDVSHFVRQLDELSRSLHCSVIYAHHHGKGTSGYRNAMNRASGSGVFGRHVDACIDLTEIEPKDVGRQLPEGQTAWRVEGTLRSFARFKPFEVVFEYPVHHRIDGLEQAGYVSGELDAKTNSKRGNQKKQDEIERQMQILVHAVKQTPEQQMTILNAAAMFENSPKTIRRWITEKHPEAGLRIDGKLIVLDEPPEINAFDDDYLPENVPF